MVLKRLNTLSDKLGQACQIRANLAVKLTQLKGAKIALKWVPGYEDIIRNEEVDRLAKLAAINTLPIIEITSFTYIGTILNSLNKKEWSTTLLNYSEKHLKDKGYKDSYSTIYSWSTLK